MTNKYPDMLTVNDISRAIEAVAPLTLQESFDNSGLQCGDPRQTVSRVLCCLDITEEVVEEAHKKECQMVVSHHPLIFGGINRIDPTHDYVSRVLIKSIQYGICLYSAHTNLDKAEGGVNYRLAKELELQDLEPMSECGVVGNFETPRDIDTVLGKFCEKLNVACLNCNWDDYMLAHEVECEPVLIHRVAVCGGSGAQYIEEAKKLGADAFLTGEIKYHTFFGQPDILLIGAGHFESEQFTVGLLVDIVSKTGVEAIATTVRTNPIAYF